MLPYMPFHHLLFEHISADALVMTSGNFSDEPIIIDNQEAIETFLKSTDGVLAYNRDIYNRIDDPVLTVVNDKPRLIRRSRGYVPGTIKLPVNIEGIFASGAELTGTFCIGKGNNAIPSQYFGDLQNYDNLNFYIESYNRFSELFRFEPELVVADLHPDYNSTRFAQKIGAKIEYVQHHHAHVASVIAEHNIQEPVIGVAFDGTGLGTDGNIWGSEFLICHDTEFERYSHFDYIPLPGGDKAVLEPWRCGISFLKQAFGKDFLNLDIPFIKNLDKSKTNLLIEAFEKGINIPLSCGSGRLFDAVASITGICNNPTFHAEAPMRLEAHANVETNEYYNFEVKNGIIRFKLMWNELIEDLLNKTSANFISTKFHNTIVEIIINQCINIRKEKGISKVVLCGGTFQNKFLLKKCENILTNNLFEVYTNLEVPSNDAGIALGQLYLAAKKR
jgi:hydrogenase maturation protein HypF